MQTPRYPRSVIIEPTNRCNMRCRSCHFWGEGVERHRAVGSIDPELARAMIEEISHWDAEVDLMLTGAGEPLLHPEICQMISWAAEAGNISVGILSNGLLMDPETAERLVESGIHWIGFSVDGADPERYSWYRGAELEVVERHIEHLLSLRKGGRPRVFLNMVAIPNSDPLAFVERWRGRVDEVKVSTFRPVGSRSVLGKCNVALCENLFTMMVVTWEGEVALCCEDIWADCVVGRFPQRSLEEIWRGEPFERFRDLHRRYEMEKIPLCATCDMPYCAKRVKEYWDNGLGCRVVEGPAQTSYLFS